MNVQQAINNPLGINVFGSALLVVAPDVVSLEFSVLSVAPHPNEAFQNTRSLVQKVSNYLSSAPVMEFNPSHIELEQATQYKNNEHVFIGYRARVRFVVLSKALNKVEEILGGLVDAGVNIIMSVNYQTTQLKTLREEARRSAVHAAREKAEIYCSTAGVTLGEVLHIEDVNPDNLRGYEGHQRVSQPNDSEIINGFTPTSIVVRGAVMMTFAIKQK